MPLARARVTIWTSTLRYGVELADARPSLIAVIAHRLCAITTNFPISTVQKDTLVSGLRPKRWLQNHLEILLTTVGKQRRHVLAVYPESLEVGLEQVLFGLVLVLSLCAAFWSVEVQFHHPSGHRRDSRL